MSMKNVVKTTQVNDVLPSQEGPMKHQHRHGHRTRHGHGHVDICNVQNIERSTGVVSDTDTDACRTQTRQGTGVSVLHREGLL